MPFDVSVCDKGNDSMWLLFDCSAYHDKLWGKFSYNISSAFCCLKKSYFLSGLQEDYDKLLAYPRRIRHESTVSVLFTWLVQIEVLLHLGTNIKYECDGWRLLLCNSEWTDDYDLQIKTEIFANLFFVF